MINCLEIIADFIRCRYRLALSLSCTRDRVFMAAISIAINCTWIREREFTAHLNVIKHHFLFRATQFRIRKYQFRLAKRLLVFSSVLDSLARARSRSLCSGMRSPTMDPTPEINAGSKSPATILSSTCNPMARYRKGRVARTCSRRCIMQLARSHGDFIQSYSTSGLR